MRRRSLLAAVGLGLLGGCVARDGGGEATPTETPSSDAVTPPGSEFASTVRRLVEDPIHFSREGGTWVLEYPTTVTQGEPFDTEQARIARAFTRHRPAEVSLSATATHDCMTVDWRVSASLARRYDAGELAEEDFLDRIRETTDRTNTC